MTNPFLEKIALNATKARAIAKQVGVVPDPLTNWKWAVRNLRDRIGKPLQGEALQTAKAKMGAMSKDSFSRLQKAQKAHPDRELGFYTDSKTLKNVYTGKADSISVDIAKHHANAKKGLMQGHTHHSGPSIAPRIDDEIKRHPARITFPSGRWPHVDSLGKFNAKKFSDVLFSDHLADRVVRAKLSPAEEQRVWEKFSPKTRAFSGYGRDLEVSHTLAKETKGFARKSTSTIAAPEHGLQAVHRLTSYDNMDTGAKHYTKLRSVVFDHN